MFSMRKPGCALAVCLAAATSGAYAADGHSIAQKNNCFACHSIEQKIVGPAFKAVASKYRGNSQAEAILMAKVKSGGEGVWGSTPMPAQSQLSEAELKTVVDWVLAQ
jgi:cytochrome c